MEGLAPFYFGSTVLSQYLAALVGDIGDVLSCMGLANWYLPCSSFGAVLARRYCNLDRLGMTKWLQELLIKLGLE